MYIVYDVVNDLVVASSDTEEGAKGAMKDREMKAVAETAAWHEKVMKNKDIDLWEHMKAFWYSLALDVTQYEIRKI